MFLKEADHALRIFNKYFKINEKFIRSMGFIVGGLLFIAAGLCFLVSEIKHAINTEKFLSDAVKATAIVTDIDIYYDKNPNHHDIYTTTFQYEAGGKTYTGKTKWMDFKPDWEKADVIEIYYDPENPQDTYVYNKHDTHYRLMDFGFGIAFLSIGTFLLVYTIKNARLNRGKALK